MNRMKKKILAGVPALTLIVLGWSAPASAQERDQGSVVLKLSELTLRNYSPKHATAGELERLATAMIGRSYYIEERGGPGFSKPVSNIAWIGNGLVLYDTEDYVQRMLATLEELDVPHAEASREEGDEANLRVGHYQPRFLSTEACEEALESFRRTVDGYDDGPPNIGVVSDRGTLVLRDSEARVKEMLGLLEEIDKPEDQVVLKCYLLKGTRGPVDSESDDPAPKELIDNLSRILPGRNFERIGFAMLQSSVAPRRTIQLGIADREGSSLQLSLKPVAYDRETGSITGKAELVDKTVQKSHTMMETQTTFRGGQYTVLGATGQDPVFVVIHLTRSEPHGGSAGAVPRGR